MNTNKFIDAERVFAFAPEMMTRFGVLAEQFGVELPDGTRMVKTVAARWDDAAKTRKRAASPENEIPFQLTDGRIAIRVLWSEALIAAWQAGVIPAEELTREQLAVLLPPLEELPDDTDQ